MKMKYLNIFIAFCWLFYFGLQASYAQQFVRPENRTTREGNQLFKNGSFEESTQKYLESININKDNPYANFNMGAALYKMGKQDSALSYFNNAIQQTDNKILQSQAHHNAGNVHLGKKEYEKAIQSYKNALKAAPNNQDARYNLKYAQRFLQQQQEQQQQQQNQDKDQKKEDQEKDNQNKDEKDKQDNNKNEKDKEKEKQPAADQDQNNLSKEQAERMLNAIENKEKELQKKLNEQQGAPRKNNDKNW